MFIFISYFFQFILLQSIGNPASYQAEKINKLFNYFNIVAACMLLLVCFLVIFICIKFKEKKGDLREPKQTTGNKKVEALMIGIPTLLLIWFFYQSLITMNAVASPVPQGEEADIIITGHQWWWEVYYPKANVITANEVHLPVGKHLLMEMRSADVIHDWWVPQLGNKMDLVPKINNYLWLDINKPGKYIGACSEFCGAQHAWMRINVVAEGENDFQNWLARNSKDAVIPKDSLTMKGAEIFQTQTCASCHRIQGTAATSNVGPDLTHVASRSELLTGLMKNNEANLYKWINHPQQVKPGARMPDFKYGNDSVNAIVHYLAQLK
jgi:cytochrome c oxidase subunit II